MKTTKSPIAIANSHANIIGHKIKGDLLSLQPTSLLLSFSDLLGVFECQSVKGGHAITW